ncbi:MAG: aminotransferase class III-fold pyridoxal phosphate-dependent enzyme [Caulobacteraceae bacterium]|nr:aminotransferase class III-fold pyridoxal phosphate-dependent enzyme [Caulobacteraceae bacterium]
MARAAAQAVSKTSSSAARARRVAPSYASALKSARMALGAVVTDRSGAERLDLCNADGSVLLGWADARVENAVANARSDRHCQAEAAERIGMLLPCAEAVAFRSNLTHALTDALGAAKRLTGRDGAFFCDDETVARNDSAAITAALDRHAGQVAALVVRPMEAGRAFLSSLRRLCSRDSIVLIFDESRTAFRVHKGGMQAMHGVTPDITLLGAALANGRPIAAIAGRIDPLRHLSASGDRVPGTALAAACATLDQVVRADVPENLTLIGAEIEAEVLRRLQSSGASAWLGLYGDPTWSIIAARPRPGFDGEALENALACALYQRGILSFGAHAPSLALGPAQLNRLLAAYDAVLPSLVERARSGEFDRRLRRSALAR